MILGVAIKEGDLVICLPKPSTHAECISFAIETLGLIVDSLDAPALKQGFYTDKGAYLNREEAVIYAHEHGQLINPSAHQYLSSNDLW